MYHFNNNEEKRELFEALDRSERLRNNLSTLFDSNSKIGNVSFQMCKNPKNKKAKKKRGKVKKTRMHKARINKVKMKKMRRSA